MLPVPPFLSVSHQVLTPRCFSSIPASTAIPWSSTLNSHLAVESPGELKKNIDVTATPPEILLWLFWNSIHESVVLQTPWLTLISSQSWGPMDLRLIWELHYLFRIIKCLLNCHLDSSSLIPYQSALHTTSGGIFQGNQFPGEPTWFCHSHDWPFHDPNPYAWLGLNHLVGFPSSVPSISTPTPFLFRFVLEQ